MVMYNYQNKIILVLISFVILAFILLYFEQTKLIGSFLLLFITISYFLMSIYNIYKKKWIFSKPKTFIIIINAIQYSIFGGVMLMLDNLGRISYILLLLMLFLSLFFKKNNNTCGENS